MSATPSASFADIDIQVLKDKSLKELVDAAVRFDPTSTEDILEKIQHRDQIGSTEVAPGFFIPHVVTDSVPRIQLVLGTEGEVTWLLVLMPSNAVPESKRALSLLMRQLAYEEEVSRIRSFSSTEQFQHYLAVIERRDQ
ncbi:hypothetical protein N24_3085 [Corynebacterium suranareeae]|uniref:PTS EIIA type-2 domain-containing protein n=1 Tax=Corynebacterium suranareeae TaxID=2506452 RepID=A0A160PSR3_9CORY|nr:PTS sugar transporter subunit IIA [Corynebacterium suranareeae]BAU97347.1 hypothetical protein N24_3085 [Corynebacterium suranareeae]